MGWLLRDIFFHGFACNLRIVRKKLLVKILLSIMISLIFSQSVDDVKIKKKVLL